MIGRKRPYLSYLLRLWLAEGDGPVWRASLENPTTAERHGFANLESLFTFLAAETRDLAAEWQWEEERAAKELAAQEALKDLLGRAMADEEFRALLLANPEQALKDGGYDLTAEQLAALLQTDTGGIADGLDERLAKMLHWGA